MAARVHVLDTDDDAGPCEDIVVLAKTHSGPCEDIVVLANKHNGASEVTYCESARVSMAPQQSISVRNIDYESPMVNTGPEHRIQVRNIEYRSGTSNTGPKNKKM